MSWPPTLKARPNNPWAPAVTVLPTAVAKVSAPLVVAVEVVRTAKAAPSNPWASALVLLPTAVAKVSVSPVLVVAAAPVPTAKDAPKNPSAWADAPLPIAKATPNSELLHSAAPPIPKNDAQVAFAVGANPNPALATNALVTAPATRPPAILRGEFTMLRAIIC